MSSVRDSSCGVPLMKRIAVNVDLPSVLHLSSKITKHMEGNQVYDD
ncbi:hypothetical protein RvY_11634 [Ramazzottius varieornatus]|uniref:Uncharacterized protein n=1 Tax=Ramazzottius varieornatus TaxID=947166 RepID=A0A1D1VIU0_RAMVA|nr:hypothetical protein RvY_11622 [Ramazzottius varieornatus]GAV00841.1 hypothetical protein RvY_11634 [Ramazzottius varieornatus]